MNAGGSHGPKMLSISAISCVKLLTNELSLRSKSSAVSVCDICAQFGGGGHALAAGARMRGPLQDAEARFLQAAQTALSPVNK